MTTHSNAEKLADRIADEHYGSDPQTFTVAVAILLGRCILAVADSRADASAGLCCFANDLEKAFDAKFGQREKH